MLAIKVLTVFGTRPEAVKMAPLIKELEKHSEFQTAVCVTAQHREMLDQVLELFDIKPDYDLDIMKSRQGLTDITVNALTGLVKVISEFDPDVVLVHGDTTTTFAASLAAYYCKKAVGHVEAGLRTYNKYFPYPEEMNRRLTACIAELHFAPTEANRVNLLQEGIEPTAISVTGNTVIDALRTTVDKGYSFTNNDLRSLDFSRRIIAVTAHRRENLGAPLENICRALKRIADRYEDVTVVYAVHLNPAVSETAHRILGAHPRICLTSPLDPRDMHNFLDRIHLVLTDSGGLQEEAPALGKPVLVLRNETERPEAVVAGTVRIAGTDEENIFRMTCLLLDSEEEYRKMSNAVNPYGDGKASIRIAQSLLYHFGIRSELPEQFIPEIQLSQ